MRERLGERVRLVLSRRLSLEGDRLWEMDFPLRVFGKFGYYNKKDWGFDGELVRGLGFGKWIFTSPNPTFGCL
jgi:hypothetical protein